MIGETLGDTNAHMVFMEKMNRVSDQFLDRSMMVFIDDISYILEESRGARGASVTSVTYLKREEDVCQSVEVRVLARGSKDLRSRDLY